MNAHHGTMYSKYVREVLHSSIHAFGARDGVLGWLWRAECPVSLVMMSSGKKGWGRGEKGLDVE